MKKPKKTRGGARCAMCGGPGATLKPNAPFQRGKGFCSDKCRHAYNVERGIFAHWAKQDKRRYAPEINNTGDNGTWDRIQNEI